MKGERAGKGGNYTVSLCFLFITCTREGGTARYLAASSHLSGSHSADAPSRRQPQKYFEQLTAARATERAGI
jgi:hypothetical protein